MSQIAHSTYSFTRPPDTNAYTLGDLIANNTTAGSVIPMFFIVSPNFKLQRVHLKHTSTSTSNAQFRLHFYTTSPIVTTGDNGVWLSTGADYLGSIDIDATQRAFSDIGIGFGLFATSDVPTYFAVNDTTRKVYGLLEARAAYTPAASETFTITLYGETY